MENRPFQEMLIETEKDKTDQEKDKTVNILVQQLEVTKGGKYRRIWS